MATKPLKSITFPDLPDTYVIEGVTDEIKDALLQIASKVAYIDDDGADYYQDLYDALYNTTWPVTNTLTHCSSSNTAGSVVKGEAYSATITASVGYTLTGATVSITMGGSDITSTAYSNGTISIDSVTGALVISVSAAAKTVSSISAVYTQSGKVYDIDPLDSLKNDLVVTATYNDTSTAIVPSTDYTLSGTLAAGTSTITVTYSGKTTTFDVTVEDGLPSGYTAVTYIKNATQDQNCAVNTGLNYAYGSNNYEHELVWAVDRGTNGEGGIFGLRAASGTTDNSMVIWVKYDSATQKYPVNIGFTGHSMGYSDNPVTAQEKNTIIFTHNNGNEILYFNGVEKINEVEGSFTVNSSVYFQLFKANTYGSATSGKINNYHRIYKYSVKNLSTGEYAALMIPCKNSSDEAGYYDYVRREFYTATGGAAKLTAVIE